MGKGKARPFENGDRPGQVSCLRSSRGLSQEGKRRAGITKTHTVCRFSFLMVIQPKNQKSIRKPEAGGRDRERQEGTAGSRW